MSPWEKTGHRNRESVSKKLAAQVALSLLCLSRDHDGDYSGSFLLRILSPFCVWHYSRHCSHQMQCAGPNEGFFFLFQMYRHEVRKHSFRTSGNAGCGCLGKPGESSTRRIVPDEAMPIILASSVRARNG
ncbi:MAG: hypothetical protein WHS83_17585, partial [Chloroflexus sp.]|uniref:hypothetical protein n=1 Tax=Chloroflexus sp. TaxID=1904827 RepID=UPI0030B4DA8C